MTELWSAVPSWCSCHQAAHRRGIEHPGRQTPTRRRQVIADHLCQLATQPRAQRHLDPCLGLRMVRPGNWGRSTSRRIAFALPATQLEPGRHRPPQTHQPVSRNGERTSSECAMLMRSTFTSIPSSSAGAGRHTSPGSRRQIGRTARHGRPPGRPRTGYRPHPPPHLRQQRTQGVGTTQAKSWSSTWPRTAGHCRATRGRHAVHRNATRAGATPQAPSQPLVAQPPPARTAGADSVRRRRCRDTCDSRRTARRRRRRSG